MYPYFYEPAPWFIVNGVVSYYAVPSDPPVLPTAANTRIVFTACPLSMDKVLSKAYRLVKQSYFRTRSFVCICCKNSPKAGCLSAQISFCVISCCEVGLLFRKCVDVFSYPKNNLHWPINPNRFPYIQHIPGLLYLCDAPRQPLATADYIKLLHALGITPRYVAFMQSVHAVNWLSRTQKAYPICCPISIFRQHRFFRGWTEWGIQHPHIAA